uniref:NADH kinase n=1 Tax=Leersia perrieri TaxID=77586 RepID=A0A0D9XCQ6_9ORYZ
MALRRVLLFLKPFDVYPPRPLSASSSSPTSAPPPPLLRVSNPKVLSYLDDRCRVHKETINLCKSVLQRKSIDWISVQRNDMSNPIHDVDLVISVGGDGTLLRASHFLNSSIPVLGVNSDPTSPDEVDELTDEFDARRSTGHLCAATAANFEQILDATLDGSRQPSELSRISVKLNGLQLPTYALNDILVSHPCPASVSRFSFRKRSTTGESSHLINCRSSGLRVATSTGSTAAMLSAGGFVMPISSRELQFMIREPISPRDADKPLLHGLVKQDQHILVVWYNQDGAVYFDGSHVMHSIQHGDTLEISSDAPILKISKASDMAEGMVVEGAVTIQSASKAIVTGGVAWINGEVPT